MRRHWCWCSLVLLLFAAFAAESVSTNLVWAQAADKAGTSPQSDPLARSLRVAALQLASSSLSDSSGGIMTPLRLPQRVAVLPLRVERGPDPPLGEPALRARFVELLIGVRHGDSYVIAPLASRDAARIARLTPRGIAKGDKPDAKMLEAARKAGADCVLYGTLSPPAPGSRDRAWLVNWLLIPVGSGGKEVPSVKASVLTTLVFGDGQR